MTDDEPTVELVEEPPPARRPGRWPQLALLGAAAVVVLVIGLLDRGGGDETSLPPTTSTTSAPPTTSRTTTTRVRRPTTTTSLPRFEAGEGPLLPGAIDTALLTVGGSGLVTVHDLASGARCVNDAGGRDAWLPFPSGPVASVVALQTDRRLALVDARCELRPIALMDGYPVALTDESVWYMQEDGALLREARLDGRAGRQIDLPANTGIGVLAAGNRLVLTAAGSMTLVDPATAVRRDLGEGYAVAATRTTVAVISCPALRCRLSMLDLSSGRRRALADTRLGAVSNGTFSPDGRRFLAATARGEMFVVDLRTGAAIDINAEAPLGFTADSSWALAATSANVIAARPDGSERHVVLTIIGGNGASIVHTPRDY